MTRYIWRRVRCAVCNGRGRYVNTRGEIVTCDWCAGTGEVDL